MSGNTTVSIYLETGDPEVRRRAIALIDELSQLGVEANLSITPTPADDARDRELHHFETEQKLEEAEAIIGKLRARLAQFEEPRSHE